MLESQDVVLVETDTVGDTAVPGLPRGPAPGTSWPGQRPPPASADAMTSHPRSTGEHLDDRKGLYQ